jgi:hypothetical protein
MTNGSVTLNGVTEKQLAHIIEFKVAHEGRFQFNAAQGPQQQIVAKGPGQTPSIVYNNETISWNDDAGLKVVLELLHALVPEPHHESAT